MRVAVIAYDRISPFMLSTPLAVFGEPFLAAGHRVDVCAAEPRVAAGAGLTIEVPHSLETARTADVIVLPGWRNHAEPVPGAIVDELRHAGARGAVVAGLCLGAFGVAQAGLLDGRRATTHWARADDFAARFPAVTVDPGAIFVDEGPVLTSAGVASGLDCCLHLLARVAGATEANRVARYLVVAPQRSGAHPQLVARPVDYHGVLPPEPGAGERPVMMGTGAGAPARPKFKPVASRDEKPDYADEEIEFWMQYGDMIGLDPDEIEETLKEKRSDDTFNHDQRRDRS